MNKPKLIKIANDLLGYHREISEFYSDYAKSAGLTFSSLKVLSILWKESDCTQSLIIRKSFLPKQTVNTIIKTFQKLGIIQQLTESETDKRNKIIKFTENGRKYADNIMLKIEDAECNALNILGEKDAKTLIEVIGKYKSNLKISLK
ncbi:winged helix-turn-helix transcriptional regulator [bacterium]|nr:winged helix-turn-helix transcriptional regulator [bacterium]